MAATKKKLGEGGALIGDGGSKVSKYDLKLIRRAVNGNWPITAEMRKTIADQMMQIVTKSENERTRTAAGNVMVAAVDSNIKQAKLLLDLLKFQHEETTSKNGGTTVNVGVGVGVNVTVADSVEQLLNEPDYLRFLESRHVEALPVTAGTGDAGSVRAVVESSAVCHPPAHRSHLNGHNGHSNGSNGTHASH